MKKKKQNLYSDFSTQDNLIENLSACYKCQYLFIFTANIVNLGILYIRSSLRTKHKNYDIILLWLKYFQRYMNYLNWLTVNLQPKDICLWYDD